MGATVERAGFGHVPLVPGWHKTRRGSMTDPSGSNTPVSSKITTPLQSRLQPCSGWLAITRAAWRSGASAGGHGDECWHVIRARPVRPAIRSWPAAAPHRAPGRVAGPARRPPGQGWASLRTGAPDVRGAAAEPVGDGKLAGGSQRHSRLLTGAGRFITIRSGRSVDVGPGRYDGGGLVGV